MHKTTRLPWIATSLCLGLLLAGCGPQQQKNAAQNTDSPPIAATNTAGSTGDTPATAGTPAETAAAAQQMPGSDRDEHGLYRLGRLPMVASAEKVHPDFRSGHPVGIGNRSERHAGRLPGFRKRFAPVGTLPALQPGILPAEPPENFRRPPMERRQRRHAHGGTGRRKMER